ncbi:MAG TPA: ABC transporter ATP-binding protein [Pseudonocardiaceae bacterium]|jgi:branched-chain amino acid transport system ATP-binding protein|nr:ABC transporter ATP-binding protein [Pseudonocardiaceae bacterium]
MAEREPVGLVLENVTAGYRDAVVLRQTNLTIEPGGVVGLLGPNGAGKTTLLRTVSRLTRVRSGRILLDGADVTGWAPERIPTLGVAHVPEGRRMFTGLSVLDNLLLGSHLHRRGRDEVLDEVFALFPQLRDRQKQRADTLSGGQQQMVAIGRALMQRPRLLMLDEPSQGLSPILVRQVLASIKVIAATGVTVLLVEQNARSLFEVIDEAMLMSDGVLTASIPKAQLANSDLLRQLLMEVPAGETPGRTEEIRDADASQQQ